MAFLLALETTTKNCSVALFEDRKLLSSREHNTKEYSHAEQLTLFIQDVLVQAKIKLNQIDCIVLSEGPGSYTGLRIGTSTAKGLCYSLDVPLVSVSTLQAMALQISESYSYKFYCPMIDARRMEVFSAIYDQSNNQIREIKADIIDDSSYSDFLEDKMLFFGDGALKCKHIIHHPNARFVEGIFPSAKDMGILAFKKFKNKHFEDVAYFEPFYLKDFLIGRKSN